MISYKASRKIERACHDAAAFCFIPANTYPDHDSIAHFRHRFLTPIEHLFVQVLLVAREMKCLRLGTIALDGTKIAANASKHKALPWEHAHRIQAQRREEVHQLLKLAKAPIRARSTTARTCPPRSRGAKRDWPPSPPDATRGGQEAAWQGA